jgi:dihydrodipicolinate synthase/N-acetylneuraminate lyase
VPELWEKFWNAACAKNWKDAEALQQKLDEIAQVLQRNRGLGGYLAALKTALAAQKLCTSQVLPPLRPLPATEQDEVVAGLAALHVL